MLEAKDVVKVYGRKRVVDEVSLQISKGEIVGLLGPNGAGKTTLFYSIMGVIKPESGDIYLNQEKIGRWPLHRRARAGISYLAQEPSIFRGLTVEENIDAILEYIEKDRAKRKAKKERVVEELGLGKILGRKAYLLSGGEKRRTEVARVLVTDPKYLLLDEPFVGIDPLAVQDLQEIIAGLKERNIGILITDHNVRDTLSVIDRAYIIYDGKILLSGTARELLSSEVARKVYLGDRFAIQ